jgi:hypothetical protein
MVCLQPAAARIFTFTFVSANGSVAGCKIKLFDEDAYETYVATAADWLQNIVNRACSKTRLVLEQALGNIHGIDADIEQVRYSTSASRQ